MGRRKKNRFLSLVILLFAAFVFAVSQGYLQIPEQILAKPDQAIPQGCGELNIHILNVSQADAIFIQTPKNKTILIDMASKMKKNSSDRLISFLEQNGISKIDHLIATHYHEDHIGGAEKIFFNFNVATVYSNGNCVNSTTKTSATFDAYAATSDFKIIIQDTELKIDECMNAKLIVAYDRSEDCFSDENDNSILLKIDYGNSSFLFTGDCEGECEEELIRQGTDISADVLKIGHHGSSTSSTMEFLQKTDSDYFVISTDMYKSVKDRYFHPRKVALDNIYSFSKGSNTYRTDLNGDLLISSNGNEITFTPEVAASQCDIFSGYTSADASSYSVIPQMESICN